MTVRVVLLAAAETDLAAGRDWYESQASGLGQSFIEQIDASLSSLPEFPEKYQIAFWDVRRVVVPRFPYLIAYRFRTGLVEVVGIVPCRAEPQLLARRAASRSPIQ